MKRKIIETADGSKTIFIPEWNEHYHSKHGAIQEAQHVFIKHGLQDTIACHSQFDSEFKNRSFSILEIGFGTGLNAFLTVLETQALQLAIYYTGVEAFPVSSNELQCLNFTKSKAQQQLFNRMHSLPWEEEGKLLDHFWLLKQKKTFSEIDDKNVYNLIYFDAFGVRVQPELWTETIFAKMFTALRPKGVLVTYAAAGSVRRAMQAVGFTVERLPGPPGKREMLRACKSS